MNAIDILYTGSRQAAEYVQFYLQRLEKTMDIRIVRISHVVRRIREFPWRIAKVIFLEFPSLIVIDRESQDPIATIEFFGRKPMGYNHAQFFARLFQSGRAGVPFLIIFPSKAFQTRRSAGGRNAVEYDNPIFLAALLNASGFFNCPILSFNWDMDEEMNEGREDHGYMLIDQHFPAMPDSNNGNVINFFNILLKCIAKYPYFEDFDNWDEFLIALNQMNVFLSEIRTHARRIGRFNATTMRPDAFMQWLEESYGVKKKDIPRRFHEVPTVVHINSSKTFRTDPYAGLFALFKASFCMNTEKMPTLLNLVSCWEKISIKDIKKQFFQHLGENWNGNLEISLGDWVNTSNKHVQCFSYLLDGIITRDGALWKKKDHPLSMNSPAWNEVLGLFPSSLDINEVLNSAAFGEEDVAYAIFNILRENGWSIISFNPPRGIRHVDLLGEDSGINRARDAQVPDLIGYKTDFLLILEFKVDYSQADVDKLKSLSKKAIERVLQENGLKQTANIIKGVGFCIDGEETQDMEEIQLPDEFVAFLVRRGEGGEKIFLKSNKHDMVFEGLDFYSK